VLSHSSDGSFRRYMERAARRLTERLRRGSARQMNRSVRRDAYEGMAPVVRKHCAETGAVGTEAGFQAERYLPKGTCAVAPGMEAKDKTSQSTCRMLQEGCRRGPDRPEVLTRYGMCPAYIL